MTSPDDRIDNKRPLPFISLSAEDSDAEILEQYLDEHMASAPEPGRISLPYPFFQPIDYHFVGRNASAELLLKNLDKSLTRINDPGLYTEGATYVEFNKNQSNSLLAKLFHHPTHDVFLEADVSHNSLLSELQDMLLSKPFTNSNTYDRILTQSEDGCRSLCHLEKVESFGANSAILRETFIEGVLFKSQIIWSTSQSTDGATAVIQLDLLGRVNLIYRIASSNHEAGIFSNSVDVYTATGESLFKEIPLYLGTTQDAELKRQYGYPNGNSAAPHMITVCEQGTSPFYFPGPAYQRLVFGPSTNQSDSLQGSVWGWHANPDRLPGVFSKGLYPFGDFGFRPLKNSKVSSLHHRKVMMTALNSSDKSLVTAMDFKDCYSQRLEKNPLLSSDFPGRIVNLSLRTGHEGFNCDAVASVLKKTENRILWIFAAGNDGNDACEDQLMLAKNAIGVAAIHSDTPSYIARYSRKGRHLVGTASFTAHSGTSFAAPVVAAYASEILYHYPHLSIANLKRSLMLGVAFSKLPVASGGRSDLDKALKLADLLSKSENLSNTALLKYLYNTTDESSLEQIEFQWDQIRQDLESIDRERKRLSEDIQKSKNDLKSKTQSLNDYQKCLDQDNSFMNCGFTKKRLRKKIEKIETLLNKISSDINFQRAGLRTLEERFTATKKELKPLEKQMNTIQAFKDHKNWIQK